MAMVRSFAFTASRAALVANLERLHYDAAPEAAAAVDDRTLVDGLYRLEDPATGQLVALYTASADVIGDGRRCADGLRWLAGREGRASPAGRASAPDAVSVADAVGAASQPDRGTVHVQTLGGRDEARKGVVRGRGRRARARRGAGGAAARNPAV